MTAHPRRIQLRREAGWRLPANAISVARPTIYGNPYRVGDEVEVFAPDGMTAVMDASPAMAVALFRARLDAWEPCDRPGPEDLVAEQYVADLLLGLRGLDLACWCPLDQPCHADVLLEYANR